MNIRSIILFFLFSVPLVSFPQTSGFGAGDHELMLQPTAYTMPAGTSYLTDYELFFLNYT